MTTIQLVHHLLAMFAHCPRVHWSLIGFYTRQQPGLAGVNWTDEITGPALRLRVSRAGPVADLAVPARDASVRGQLPRIRAHRAVLPRVPVTHPPTSQNITEMETIMHTVISFLPALALLAIGWAETRWVKRPAARARWAALSLRDKIARQVRRLRIGSAIQTTYLMAFASLHAAGVISFSGWLTGTIIAGSALIAVLYLLRNTLAARRAYDALGPLAYLAEVKNAFGRNSGQPEAAPKPTAPVNASTPTKDITIEGYRATVQAAGGDKVAALARMLGLNENSSLS